MRKILRRRENPPASGGAAPLRLSGRNGKRAADAWPVRRILDLDWRSISDGPTALDELHFGWVLGGRALQDVWVIPGPGQPGAGVSPLAVYGSTLRFFDAALGAWRSTWSEPVNGAAGKLHRT